jgi:hypothetical protein
MRWYRAYVGTTTDKKLGAIALRAGVSRSVIVAAWHVILESAADANAGGECQCDEFDVSAALGEPLDAIQRVMVCFAEADMFRDGRVTAWRRRQYESDSSAERTKQWRDRNKTETRRPCDVTVTPPDTESDTDTESKKVRARDLKREFEEFWKAYPKRKGSNRKSPAEKLFNAAVKSGAEPASIISGAKKFAESEATNVGTPYIPMATTWLNQRGWEDHQPDPADEERKRQLYANMEAKGWRMIDGKWVKPEEAA